MLGKWSPISKADAKARADAAINDPAWVQVGMDPFRHSYFYNREVKEGIDRVQAMIGPGMVLVLGTILGWVLLSIFGPLYDTISKLKL